MDKPVIEVVDGAVVEGEFADVAFGVVDVAVLEWTVEVLDAAVVVALGDDVEVGDALAPIVVLALGHGVVDEFVDVFGDDEEDAEQVHESAVLALVEFEHAGGVGAVDVVVVVEEDAAAAAAAVAGLPGVVAGLPGAGDGAGVGDGVVAVAGAGVGAGPVVGDDAGDGVGAAHKVKAAAAVLE